MMNQPMIARAREPEAIGSIDHPEPFSAVRLSASLTAEIDAWANELEISRSDAIRRLVEIGLKAPKK